VETSTGTDFANNSLRAMNHIISLPTQLHHTLQSPVASKEHTSHAETEHTLNTHILGGYKAGANFQRI